MYHKTIHHTLYDGTRVKFTIRDRIIDGEPFYYVNVVHMDWDNYKSLPEEEKESFYGEEIMDNNHVSVNYTDPVRLLNDLLMKYGKEWMRSEK